jgi:hypothetical protein
VTSLRILIMPAVLTALALAGAHRPRPGTPLAVAYEGLRAGRKGAAIMRFGDRVLRAPPAPAGKVLAVRRRDAGDAEDALVVDAPPPAARVPGPCKGLPEERVIVQFGDHSTYGLAVSSIRRENGHTVIALAHRPGFQFLADGRGAEHTHHPHRKMAGRSHSGCRVLCSTAAAPRRQLESKWRKKADGTYLRGEFRSRPSSRSPRTTSLRSVALSSLTSLRRGGVLLPSSVPRDRRKHLGDRIERCETTGER